MRRESLAIALDRLPYSPERRGMKPHGAHHRRLLPRLHGAATTKDLASLTAFLMAAVTAASLAGCGDSGTTTPTTTTTAPPPTPSAQIEVHGNGNIILHPSANPTFSLAVEFPLRIQETAGGTAIWNFFRVSYLLRGAEIERYDNG